MDGLNVNNVITNEDIIITYTPSVINYSYIIIKNNNYNEPVYVYDGSISQIELKEEGIYKVEIYINDILTEVGEYIIDKTPPTITCLEKSYIITQNEIFDFNDKIIATDQLDGDLSNNVTSNIDNIDFSTTGIKKIEYSVSDRAGNVYADSIYVTVKKDNSNLVFAGQMFIGVFILLIVIFFVKYIKSIKLEKRFAKYTINSSKNNYVSLLDSISNYYTKSINNLSIKLNKSILLKNKSKKYKKYIVPLNLSKNAMDVISNKLVIGILFVICFVVINLLYSKLIQIYEIIIPFILGYYLLDIIYIYRYSMYKKNIEKDLIEAITIMNNSFKAGRSIIQSIDMVANELEGPISKEFKKISSEINLGLDIEVAFKRFAKRIKTEEAIYLSSSLAILNKTGGNIIKVFNRLESTLFSKRKLKQEASALTSSSKMIMYVLMFVPVVFAIFLNIINPGFFSPLFRTQLGIILFITMIFIYITYIIIVRKVMKVRM